MAFQPHIISPIVGGQFRLSRGAKGYLAVQLSEGICTIPIVKPLQRQHSDSYKVLLKACGFGPEYDPNPELPERVLTECIVAGYRFKFHKVRRQVLDRYKKPVPDTWAEAFYLKEQVK